MLKTRIITATVLLAGFLGVLFFLPPWSWVGLCAIICSLAAWEWGGLAGWRSRARVAYAVVLGLAATFLYLPFFVHMGDAFLLSACLSVLLACLFWLLVVPFWLGYKWVLTGWRAALVGFVVLVPPAMVLMCLRVSDPLVVLMVCAVVWVADIAAYFSGRAFGGKKLAPSISPGKTWAGAIGAVVGVLVYGNVISWVALPFYYNAAPLELLGFLLPFQLILVGLAVMSMVGDLFESLLKRQAGVKDSSNILPGHGGVLDRIDSLTSTLPWVALLVLSFGILAD